MTTASPTIHSVASGELPGTPFRADVRVADLTGSDLLSSRRVPNYSLAGIALTTLEPSEPAHLQTTEYPCAGTARWRLIPERRSRRVLRTNALTAGIRALSSGSSARCAEPIVASVQGGRPDPNCIGRYRITAANTDRSLGISWIAGYREPISDVPSARAEIWQARLSVLDCTAGREMFTGI